MSNETYTRCERDQLLHLLKDARHLIARLTPFSVDEAEQILSEAIEGVAANADAMGARIDDALKAAEGLRKVTNAGVRINGDFYNCAALQVGSMVRVRVDPGNTDRAKIYSAEDGGYLGEAPKVVSASSPDLLEAINDYVSWVRRNDATLAGKRTPSDSEIDIEAEAWSHVKNLVSQAAQSPTPQTSSVGIDQAQNHDNLQLETRSDPSSGDPEYGGADPRALKHDTSQAFPLPPSPLSNKFDFQSRVAIAHGPLFDGDATDVPERRNRNFEESCETAQAFDMTLDEALALVRYTWSRPPGDRIKELGSQILTAVSLAEVAGIGAMEAAEAELDKLQQPETIARIRAKRATRHGRGPLPGLDPSAQVTIIGFDFGTEQSQ